TTLAADGHVSVARAAPAHSIRVSAAEAYVIATCAVGQAIRRIRAATSPARSAATVPVRWGPAPISSARVCPACCRELRTGPDGWPRPLEVHRLRIPRGLCAPPRAQTARAITTLAADSCG